MKRQFRQLLRCYQTGLLAHLQQNRKDGWKIARGLGQQAQSGGWQTLELAKLHEHVMITRVLPGCPAAQRDARIRQAGAFFGMAITPIESSARNGQAASSQWLQYVETLSQRSVELAASNLELNREIIQRKSAEAALKKSKQHYSELLKQSNCLQQQLRHLSRQILATQEDERREISRELHDVVARTLTSIQVRLASLKKTSALNTRSFERNIASTQHLVEKSVNIVHQFARELRPAVLDDLGLVPALRTFMENFSARTTIPAELKTFDSVEELNAPHRTVLFRVAQEALANVARHAGASRAVVSIRRLPDAICLKIKDDGKSFPVERIWQRKGPHNLGLLGMRERVEMVGGRFAIESAPGIGTTVSVRLPLGRRRAPGAEKNSQKAVCKLIGKPL